MSGERDSGCGSTRAEPIHRLYACTADAFLSLPEQTRSGPHLVIKCCKCCEAEFHELAELAGGNWHASGVKGPHAPGETIRPQIQRPTRPAPSPGSAREAAGAPPACAVLQSSSSLQPPAQRGAFATAAQRERPPASQLAQSFYYIDTCCGGCLSWGWKKCESASPLCPRVQPRDGSLLWLLLLSAHLQLRAEAVPAAVLCANGPVSLGSRKRAHVFVSCRGPVGPPNDEVERARIFLSASAARSAARALGSSPAGIDACGATDRLGYFGVPACVTASRTEPGETGVAPPNNVRVAVTSIACDLFIL